MCRVGKVPICICICRVIPSSAAAGRIAEISSFLFVIRCLTLSYLPPCCEGFRRYRTLFEVLFSSVCLVKIFRVYELEIKISRRAVSQGRHGSCSWRFSHQSKTFKISRIIIRGTYIHRKVLGSFLCTAYGSSFSWRLSKIHLNTFSVAWTESAGFRFQKQAVSKRLIL